jgi:diguanylate cyclase (GGDEF)-like protein
MRKLDIVNQIVIGICILAICLISLVTSTLRLITAVSLFGLIFGLLIIQEYLLMSAKKKAILVDREKNQVAVEETYKEILVAFEEAMLIIDKEGNIKNGECALTFFYDKGQKLDDNNIFELFPDSMRGEWSFLIENTLEIGSITEIQVSRNVEGEKRFYEVRGNKRTDEEILVIMRDITGYKKRHSLIDTLSYKDQLTNVFNRRYYEEAILELQEECYFPIGIVMIDVNGLKLINDVFGHIAGDNLLKCVANSMNTLELGKKESFVARIGGDEFVIICINTSSEEMKALIEQLLVDIKDRAINDIPVSISIGYAIQSTSSQLADEIFVAAENEMYKMKLINSKEIRNRIISTVLNKLKEYNANESVHASHVSHISKHIGMELNLPKERIKDLELAAQLHDIGNIGIDIQLLDKKGALTEKEFEQIKRHAEISYQILRSVDNYSKLADIVLSHHERVDGKGYPRELVGDEIPIESRIIMIAEAFDAMISDRPYKKKKTFEEALSELKEKAGTQFDSRIVDAFINKTNFKKLERELQR